jgi:hypothetical protein
MDVLIRASEERIEHKLEEYVREGEHCYWTVNGTPQKAEKGDKILFSDGNRVHAEGEILWVEHGEIHFTPLKSVDKPNPRKPPMRGFAYCS